ncbi:heavy-metal-associated domain-containing protein [Pedobacter frigoris]|uniref:heavy-metal-associated domain-containing protein n=1 Tax=Pedobacter frigoris TaxID=2571272 RepID=UPI0029308E5A|nr:cation transporter [Pedobacter frigoris]
MQTLKFKTNIKCGGCIATVTPYLNAQTEIDDWKVDTENPDKVLEVSGTDSLDAEKVIETLEKAGYKAEKI